MNLPEERIVLEVAHQRAEQRHFFSLVLRTAQALSQL